MSQVQHKKTVLLVDDDATLLESVRGFLDGDYNVLTAQSGDDALAVLEQHDVALLITDQRMPVMTGIEFMQYGNHYLDAAEYLYAKEPDTWFDPLPYQLLCQSRLAEASAKADELCQRSTSFWLNP